MTKTELLNKLFNGQGTKAEILNEIEKLKLKIENEELKSKMGQADTFEGIYKSSLGCYEKLLSENKYIDAKTSPNLSTTSCYYCKKLVYDNKYFYVHTMYKVTSVTKFPLGFSYLTKEVTVPRCKSCQLKHTKLAKIFGIPAFIISSSLIFKLIYFNVGGWGIIGAMLYSGLMAFAITGLVVLAADNLFSGMFFKIPGQSEIRGFPPVKTLIKEKWKLNKPDPSNVTKRDI